MKAYLFSFKSWSNDPFQYILVYAENEINAREIGSKNCFYNSKEQSKPEDLYLCTFGL